MKQPAPQCITYHHPDGGKFEADAQSISIIDQEGKRVSLPIGPVGIKGLANLLKALVKGVA
jgi:hypothetical protein